MSCGKCDKCAKEHYGNKKKERVLFRCTAEGPHKGWVVGWSFMSDAAAPAWCPSRGGKDGLPGASVGCAG